ncbi:MAG: M48 family metalloprotease [Neomegalonema sp.]|nr:M48 family metalloprotease [Neomegalonema sp.]
MLAALALPVNASAAGLIRDSEIERTLRQLITPVFSAADLTEQTVRLFIIQDNSLNAFVGTGRNMFFHTGLLRTLETPEELIGVMAHETGHITGGHLFARISAARSAQNKAIAATIIGIATAVAGAGRAGLSIAGIGNRLAERDYLSFTRSQEASADAAALAILERARIDPSGMIRVLERLEANQAAFAHNVDPYALTHPLSRQRIEFLQRDVLRSPALGAKVSAELTYWHGRMRAKLDGFIAQPGTRFTTSLGSRELDLYREAIMLHRLPSPDRALAAVDKLIEMRPSDPYYWELKGQFLLESGRGEAAIAPYRKAVALAPGDALIAGGLGQALLSADTQGHNREALQVLERAALDDPYHAGVKRSLALAYQRSGDDGMAAVVSAERMALQGQPRDALIQAQRAKALLPVGSPGHLRAEDITREIGG